MNTKPPAPDDNHSHVEKLVNKLPVGARHWAYVFLFFILAIGVGLPLWFFTQEKPLVGGTRSKSSTAQYGRVREVQQLEDGLGWGSELLVDKKKNQPAQIRFMLRDENRKPVTGANAHITLTHKESGNTQTSPLIMNEQGVYRATIPIPESGAWHAIIAVRVGANIYQTQKALDLP